MDQKTVRSKLKELHLCTTEFTMIFSGKKSAKVNGLYKCSTHEILIHNRNFTRDDGTCNENLLMYTAIHELAHHICNTELGVRGRRSHTQLFWSTFHDLLETAQEKGIYTLDVDADTRQYIDQARELSQKIAALQRELGKVLKKINERCEQQGLRLDDVTDRELQLSRKTVLKSIAAYNENFPADIGVDIQEACVQKPNDREKILNGAAQGKSIMQLKRPPLSVLDGLDRLTTEKKRLETTIRSLSLRLAEVVKQLEEAGQDPPGKMRVAS
ncbi:hypothetical protein AGMMS50268_38190 [Spirochaetia bacterium]|nr:hypothetical protein AGMMS50268_38190 [Spirochaetia bacterium]